MNQWIDDLDGLSGDDEYCVVVTARSAAVSSSISARGLPSNSCKRRMVLSSGCNGASRWVQTAASAVAVSSISCSSVLPCSQARG
jgi:hypothetical protein